MENRSLYALLFVLVLVAVLVVVMRRRGPTLLPGPGNYRAVTAQDDPSQTFPFRKPELPPVRHMFADLRNDRPRWRKNYRGLDWAILRDAGDDVRVDRIADHYTEEPRVLQVPPGGAHLPSLWDCWQRSADRELVFSRASRKGGAAPSRLSLRAALEELAPVVHDTNPAFACHILRRAARKLRIDVCRLRVLDADAGWGGQALAACAADVGCYHAYLPGDDAARPYAAAGLQTLLDAHRPPGAPASDFWVRQMSVQELGAVRELYDVVFLNCSDLRPLAPSNILGAPAVSRFLRPGGVAVLFVPPGDHAARRGEAAVQLVQAWDPPKLVGVVAAAGGGDEGEGQEETARALVWAKFEHFGP